METLIYRIGLENEARIRIRRNTINLCKTGSVISTKIDMYFKFVFGSTKLEPLNLVNTRKELSFLRK